MKSPNSHQMINFADEIFLRKENLMRTRLFPKWKLSQIEDSF